MQEILIFSNPIAGRGRGGMMARRIAARARRAGFAPKIFVESIQTIASEQLACASDAKAVVAIGGDGTLRAVAERLLACSTSVPPIVVVPFGTANLMARHLGLKWNEQRLDREVIEAILHGTTRQLDVARANDKLFLLMAGVGIDAQIVHVLNEMRQGPIDLTSYIFPAALAFGFYQYPRLTVLVDGQRVFGPQSAVAFVGNAAEYGTGFSILPLARTDDGVLDVCIMACRTRGDLVRLFLLAAAGEHLHEEGVVYTKGKQIQIESSEPAPLQIDGDAAGFTPVRIGLLDTRLSFIVPRKQQ